MRIKFMSTAVMLKNCKITNKKEIYQQYTPKKNPQITRILI